MSHRTYLKMPLIAACLSITAFHASAAGGAEPTAMPGSEHLTAALQSFVDEKAQASVNTFYVAPQDSDETTTALFWREAKQLRIIDMGAGDDPEIWWEVLHLPPSGTVIDLENDVVPTTEDVGSSTYLVDAAWAQQQVFDAVVYGQQIVVKKSAE